MFIRTLLGAACAAAAITTISAGASAQGFDRTAFDACNPEAWDVFGYAVENRDYGLLAEMLNDAQYRACDFYETAELLICDVNPLACEAPSADVPDVVDNAAGIAEGPFPGQRPGQSLGNENDGGDSGGGGNEPGGSGDSGRGPAG